MQRLVWPRDDVTQGGLVVKPMMTVLAKSDGNFPRDDRKVLKIGDILAMMTKRLSSKCPLGHDVETCVGT